MENYLIEVIKALVVSSIFFVWVVRYQNIVEEFKLFSYPSWLRDIVGIIKLTCALLILQPSQQLVLIGSAGIVLLMIAAVITHIRVSNPLPKMLPSLALLALNACIFCFSWQS